MRLKPIFSLLAALGLYVALATPAMADYKGLWDWTPNYRGSELYVLGDASDDTGLYLLDTSTACVGDGDSLSTFRRALVNQGKHATWWISHECGARVRVCTDDPFSSDTFCRTFKKLYPGDGWMRYDEVRDWK